MKNPFHLFKNLGFEREFRNHLFLKHCLYYWGFQQRQMDCLSTQPTLIIRWRRGLHTRGSRICCKTELPTVGRGCSLATSSSHMVSLFPLKGKSWSSLPQCEHKLLDEFARESLSDCGSRLCPGGYTSWIMPLLKKLYWFLTSCRVKSKFLSPRMSLFLLRTLIKDSYPFQGFNLKIDDLKWVVIPWNMRGIGSRTSRNLLWLPKAMDAQVPYIKWQSICK